MSIEKLRVGIIGANYTLIAHSHAWRALPGVEIGAVCTAHKETAEAAAKEYDIPKAYWDYRQMVEDPNLDIITVGTRPSQRYEMVMSALENGKHVYNCLPFAVNVEQARAMRDKQWEKGVVGVADAQFRWVPAIRHLKELIGEGKLGEFFQATIHMQLPLLAYDGFVYPYCVQSETQKPYVWLSEANSGASAWRNFGSHTMLNLLYLFGEIEEVIGYMDVFAKEWKLTDGRTVRPQTPDIAMALVRFRNGGMANINVSWSTVDAAGYFLEVTGSRGRMVVRDPSFADAFSATLYFGDSRKRDHRAEIGSLVDIPDRLYQVPGTSLNKANCQPFMGTMAPFLHDMCRAIREGGEGSPSFNEAYHVHRAVEGVVRSMSTRAWVRVDDVN
jgi:predicted dehydrogenase